MQASKYIEFDHSFNDDEKSLESSLLSLCSLNNAACKLKLEKYLSYLLAARIRGAYNLGQLLDVDGLKNVFHEQR